MAHPIRPESYIAMDNFYTDTVYNKGAEVCKLFLSYPFDEGQSCAFPGFCVSHSSSFVNVSVEKVS